MSAHEKNIYSAKEIQHYHEGSMSSAERHALEKAALEDPFLADAIEGYLYTNSAQADLITLQKNLGRNLDKGKVITLYSRTSHRLQIAALFLLLAGCGWVIYKTVTDQQDTDLALDKASGTKNISPSTPEATTISADTNDTFHRNELAAKSVKKTKRHTDINTVLRKNPKQLPNQNKMAEKKNNSQDEVNAISSAGKKDESNAESVKPAESKVFVSSVLSKSVVKGQVVNAQGAPIPFAAIVDQKNKIATSSDASGQFILPVTDSSLNATVMAVGYQHGKLNIRGENKSNHTIVMKETNESLNEVVVTSLGTRKGKKDVSSLIETGKPEPVAGWAHFNAYIKNNLRIPSEYQNKEGEVVLSFTINEEGKPINPKVEKTLCTACDAEAIRVLENGPKWKQANGSKGRVSIKF